MGQVLQKALGCICAIVLGYVLKRVGFFRPSEKDTIKKITMNITLPAAVITSFAGFQPQAQLYLSTIRASLSHRIRSSAISSVRPVWNTPL